MVLALVLVLFLFSFSSIYLCWMFFFVLLRFVLFCRRILFYCHYLLLCLSVRPFGCLTAIVIVVFYLPPLCVYDGLSSYLNHNKNTSYRISVCDNFRDYLSTNIRWMRIVLLSTMLFLKRNGKRKLMRDRERGRERKMPINNSDYYEHFIFVVAVYSFSSINLFGFREKFCSKCLNEI